MSRPAARKADPAKKPAKRKKNKDAVPNGRRARKGTYSIAQAKGLLKAIPKNPILSAASRRKAKETIYKKFPSLRRA